MRRLDNPPFWLFVSLHLFDVPGIPTVMYGLAATQLIRHREIVKTPRGDVTIYFLLPEDKGSQYWDLHLTTLICVESHIMAFLRDDINGNEI